MPMLDEQGYARADIASFEELYRVFTANPPDLVIHAAGEVGRLNGERYPGRMIRTNCLGTLNIARLCLDHNSRLINFSTSEVYGESFDSTEVDEETVINALGLTNVYAISKMTGEAIVRHYSHSYGLRAITVRPFMIYGEGERPGRFRSAICNFVDQAIHSKPLIVHKRTQRAWCYVSDFVDGLSLLLNNPMSNYSAYNIGSTEYETTRRVAEMVLEEVRAPKSLIQLVSPPALFASRTKRASIQKMRSLGYSPRVSLREGIRKVVSWQRNL
jgi:nucleoside-diphosphate-sugar epimerase